MTWMRYNGRVLRDNTSGKVAVDESCCCGGVCNCPVAPHTLWVHLRTVFPSVCGWRSFQITYQGSTPGCDKMWFGRGFMDCWTSAPVPCGRLAPVCVTLCQNMTCEVSIACAQSGECGDDSTISFSFDSCDPLEGCAEPITFLTCAPCGSSTEICINTSGVAPPP